MYEMKGVDPIIIELLKEYNDHRAAIKKMIVDLEKIQVKVDTIFPETMDKRFIRIFEEKIKAVTGLFNSLLDMRKEIAHSIKDEIEVRRRLGGEGDSKLEDLLDVRKIAKKVELFQKTANDKIERVEEMKNVG